METVTRFVDRHAGPASMAPPPAPDAVRTVAVAATYLLSQDGRKASLLGGGDGQAVQQITLHVPENRLHLVAVDRQGVARLKLRPRFEVDSERGIVQINSAPRYDSVPSIDDLYRAAAKNHELESAYDAQQTARKSRRRETEVERRERIAEAFLGDKEQRAGLHPPPTPRECYLFTDRGWLLFDVESDQGIAKDVPAEAHRRFRADARAKQERDSQDRAAQLAQHKEKEQFVAAWLAENGSAEQKVRRAAGVFPVREAVEAIADRLFAAFSGRPRYTHDGVQRLQKHLAQFPDYAGASVTAANLVVSTELANEAGGTQWAVVEEFKAAFPGASVLLLRHRLGLKRDLRAPTIIVTTVLVTLKHGPFTLRREYLADGCLAEPGSCPALPKCGADSRSA